MTKISQIIGIVSIFFVGLTVITIIFPSLFSSVFGKFSSNLISFELGILGMPLVVSNVVLILFGVLYVKKKFPNTISNYIDKIRVFEIPKKPSFIILLIIFSIYIGFSIPELSIDESTEWPDYKTLADALEIWPDGESDNVYIQEQNDRYVRMFLLDSSLNIFQNIKPTLKI